MNCIARCLVRIYRLPLSCRGLKCQLIDFIDFSLFVLLCCCVSTSLEVNLTMYKVEVVESSPISVLGEGPHWDVERQSLYYNDIYGDKQSISRYDYNEDKTYNAVIPGHPVISFIIPVDETKDQVCIQTRLFRN